MSKGLAPRRYAHLRSLRTEPLHQPLPRTKLGITVVFCDQETIGLGFEMLVAALDPL